MTNIDPPTRIVVIGAGPIGIEAGLYARYLGHEVTILEKHEVAFGLLHSSDDPLWGPFDEHVTQLGLNALVAQNEDYQPLEMEQPLVGHWLANYLFGVAQSDLIAGSMVVGAAVHQIVAVEDDTEEFEEDADHLEVRYRIGDEEKTLRAGAVIDASGNSNGLLPLESLGIPTCDKWGSINGLADDFSLPDAFKIPANKLILPLPYYYCVGIRSFGQWTGFQIRHGHLQVRELFKIIGGRDSLDLYQ